MECVWARVSVCNYTERNPSRVVAVHHLPVGDLVTLFLGG